MNFRRSDPGLACFLLSCFLSVACHRSNEAEGKSRKTAPSAAPEASASATKVAASVWPPPAPPRVPPQLVACGGRDFYRIDQQSLQVFEINPVTPPPQIRGSAVARQTTEVEITEPKNVLWLAKKRVLVIAKKNLLLYELDGTGARRYLPVATPRLILAWPDPREVDTFWLHNQGERTVRQFRLGSLPESEAKSAPKQPKAARPVTAGQVQELTDFDSRLFTVLSDGTPLYSTKDGLRRLGDSSDSPFPAPSQPATGLFADPTPDRYWLADASGALVLWDRKRAESPVFSSRVPGVVIDVASEGQRVAVLSMELAGASYRSTLSIFSKGEQKGQLSVAPTVAASGQPKLDVCLIPGRPWAVVGGKHWLQLLDWSAPRLLAEW